jgi:hypothetical protein
MPLDRGKMIENMRDERERERERERRKEEKEKKKENGIKGKERESPRKKNAGY